MMSQNFTETEIKGIPIIFYNVNREVIGEDLSLDGFVTISEKKFNLENKKSTKTK